MKRAHAASEKNETTGEGSRNEANVGVIDCQEENDQDQLIEENNGNAGSSRKRRRTSPMWQHFTVKFVQKENAEFAFCNHCTK